MEYPSVNDFYLKLKAIYNNEGNIIDYVLIYLSGNFEKATNMIAKSIIGERISNIVVNNVNKLGFKELYFNMIPKTNSKFEMFIEEINRWYLISIFSDDEENMIIFYNDITEIKKGIVNKIIKNKSQSNIYEYQDIERIYYRDKLTGLYNKAFYEEELSRLDTNRQLPLSIIMGDINGLKLINDAFGHFMGDKALTKAAEIMKNSFRKEDIISRVGGDEYLIILPKTSESMALSIINRIKTDCEKNPLDFIKISISFGVATKTSELEDIFDKVKLAEERMYFNKLKESKESKLALISFLKNNLEKITFETKAHYERLKEYSLMMANELNLSEEDKEELQMLCDFHDIGKIGIPKHILQKEGTLNLDEWKDIKRHSEIGYYIIKEFREPLVIDELILIHHERWDGKGYPGLLKKEEIPVVVRIFAIADAYDAMVNDRPYKNRMTNVEALKEIADKSGTQFDPIIAQIFIKIMEEKEYIA